MPVLCGGSLVTSVPRVFMEHTRADVAVVSEASSPYRSFSPASAAAPWRAICPRSAGSGTAARAGNRFRLRRAGRCRT